MFQLTTVVVIDSSLPVERAPMFGCGISRAAIRPSGDIWSLDNDEHRMSELVSRLQTVDPFGVALESKGGLEVPLVSVLAASPWA